MGKQEAPKTNGSDILLGNLWWAVPVIGTLAVGAMIALRGQAEVLNKPAMDVAGGDRAQSQGFDPSLIESTAINSGVISPEEVFTNSIAIQGMLERGIQVQEVLADGTMNVQIGGALVRCGMINNSVKQSNTYDILLPPFDTVSDIRELTGRSDPTHTLFIEGDGTVRAVKDEDLEDTTYIYYRGELACPVIVD